MNDADAQLELAIDLDAGAARAAPVNLPQLALTKDTTPADIVHWWDDLVGVFTAEAESLQPQLREIDASLAILKRPTGGEERRSKTRLQREKLNLLRRIESAEYEAYALFESTLAEFSPELIRLLQAGGLDLPDDDEIAVAQFWDYLQRPLIEHFGEVPIHELIRDFIREETSAEPVPMDS